VALLFPGQGVKGVLGALGTAAESARGRALLDVAAASSGMSVARLFERGGRELERTEVLQPTLTAIALFVLGELRAGGCKADVVAGHSLGEIAAAAAAGWLTPEDAVEIAALRGRLMAREAARRPGGLLALRSGDEERVERALELGRASGAIAVGAVNAPDEVVLTGDLAALRAVAAAFPSTRVPVAGPWHSDAMTGAVEDLRTALRSAVRSGPAGGGERDLQVAFVCNRDGSILTDGQTLADHLAEQIALPVQWTRALDTLARFGVTDYVTVGPGATLRGLLYKHAGPGAPPRVHSTEDARDIAKTQAKIQNALLERETVAVPP
jgi:[acyl-carrier-protein] S-malonyltransferase